MDNGKSLGTCCGLQAGDVLSAVGSLEVFARLSLTEKRVWLESARACMVLLVGEMVESLQRKLEDKRRMVDELIRRFRAAAASRCFSMFPDVVVSARGEMDHTWLTVLEALCHGTEPGYTGSVEAIICGGCAGMSHCSLAGDRRGNKFWRFWSSCWLFPCYHPMHGPMRGGPSGSPSTIPETPLGACLPGAEDHALRDGRGLPGGELRGPQRDSPQGVPRGREDGRNVRNNRRVPIVRNQLVGIDESIWVGAEPACPRGVSQGLWLPRNRGVLSRGIMPEQVRVAGVEGTRLEWHMSCVSPDLYRPLSHFRRWEAAERVAGQYLNVSRILWGGRVAPTAGQEHFVDRVAPMGDLLADVAILTGHLGALGELQRDVHRALSGGL